MYRINFWVRLSGFNLPAYLQKRHSELQSNRSSRPIFSLHRIRGVLHKGFPLNALRLCPRQAGLPISPQAENAAFTVTRTTKTYALRVMLIHRKRLTSKGRDGLEPQTSNFCIQNKILKPKKSCCVFPSYFSTMNISFSLSYHSYYEIYMTRLKNDNSGRVVVNFLLYCFYSFHLYGVSQAVYFQ